MSTPTATRRDDAASDLVDPGASQWDTRCFTALLVLVVGKAVLPSFVTMLAVGRPLPGSKLELTGTANAIGQATTFAILLLCLTVVLSRRTTVDFSPVGVGWLTYLAIAAIASWYSGFLPLPTLVTSAAALVAAMHLRLDGGSAARSILLVVSAVTTSSLVLSLLDPDLARFGSDLYAEPGRGSRLAGILDQPNQLGLISGIAVVAAVVVLRSRSHRTLGTIGLLAGVAGLALSESYTSWIASMLGAGIAFIAPARDADSRFRSARLFAVAGGGLALIAVVVRTVRDDVAASTVSGRQLVWAFANEYWPERPLIGHGSGAWTTLINNGSLPTWAVHAHNQVLNTLYVGGVLTLAALLAALLFSVIRAVRGWRAGVGLCAGLLVYQVVRSYSEVPFELTFAGLNLLIPLTLTACRLDDRRGRRDA